MTPLWRGSSAQRARLVSGLILFVFAAAHFINHALGLVSLDAMNAFDAWRVAIIRSWPGTLILATALLLHVILTLSKVVFRRSLRLPVWQAVQIGMGLAIPIFLLPHIVNTRGAAVAFGVQDTYAYELFRLWPNGMLGQTTLLVLVWVHGCMGLHYWLRLSPTYRRCIPVLFAGAVLLPFAAFAGLSVQGRVIQAEMADASHLSALKSATHWMSSINSDRLVEVRGQIVDAFYGVLAAVGVALVVRTGFRRRGSRIMVSYVGGPTVGVAPGETLLDVSRHNGVPHLSVCGGRGRCSTCRVMIVSGDHHLDAPSPMELETLRSVQAGPQVRLACQAHPHGDVTVMPLLKSDQAVNFLPAVMTDAPGVVERDLSVLFVDMRGFTTMTERMLAFDVVFILNQFFNTVGKPIYDFGGVITNYAGDGLTAMFSDPTGIEGACRSSLLAACQIDRAISDLNARLVQDMQQPMRIAMGLHAGPHVLGRIGYKDAVSQTVVGLAMNIASRMEALAKQAGVQLAVSLTVADHAGLDTTGLRVEETEVRGLQAPLGVVLVPSARDLESRLQRQPELV